MTKRGLSVVIATVLILLLTVALAAIIAGVVVPFVKNSLRKSTECIPFQKQFVFDSAFEYNCYKTEGSLYSYKFSLRGVSIDKENEEELAGFSLITLEVDSGNSKAIQIREGIVGSCTLGTLRNLEDSCPSPGLIKTPKSGETRSYAFTSDKILKSVEVAALLKSGKQCEISDSIRQIPPCRN